MPLFCSTCLNLMEIVTSSDSFVFRCNKCEKTEIPNDKDSLRYEMNTGTNLVVYKSILSKAGKDPVNPKVKKICDCGYDKARQVRLGSEMKLINTCIECNRQWLDGTKETD